MFAVVRTGGKQYRVAAGDKIVVEKMGGEAGDTIRLSDVLFAGHGAEVRNVEGLLVSAEIIAQAKADKVIVFKKRRRHNYRRKNGHRQQLTILRITAVGDDTIDMARERQAGSAVVADDGAMASTASRQTASDETTLPTASVMEPAATEPQVQEPLKVETSESPMVDTPTADDDSTDATKAI